MSSNSQDKLEDKIPGCFLCNREFHDDEAAWLLFEQRENDLGLMEFPLAEVIWSALGKQLHEDDVHSKLLCYTCNVIVTEYEAIEKQLYQLKHKIVSNFNLTAKSHGLETIVFQENEKEYIQERRCNELHVEDNSRSNGHYEETQNYVEKEAVCDKTANLKENQESNIDEPVEEHQKSFQYDGENYKCLLCTNSQEVNVANFALHMKSFHFIRIYVCIHCNRKFKNESVLNDHIDKDHADRVCVDQIIHSPDVSDRSVGRTLRSRNSIVSEKHTPTSTPWKQIETTFETQNDVSKNTKTHIERSRPYKCTQCKRDFLYNHNLKQHMKTHVQNATKRSKQFGDLDCETTFANKDNVDQHMKTHSKRARSYKCTKCPKTFIYSRNLGMHMKTHIQNIYNCNMCSMSFNGQLILNEHFKTEHRQMYNNSLKNYECNLCNKRYLSQYLLDEHSNKHLGLRPFVCRNCSKSYTSKYILNAHMKRHDKRSRQSKKRPKFKSQSKIKSTTEITKQTSSINYNCNNNTVTLHTSRYNCDLCGKFFRKIQNLKVHRLTHDKERIRNTQNLNPKSNLTEVSVNLLDVNDVVINEACEKEDSLGRVREDDVCMAHIRDNIKSEWVQYV